MPVYEYRCPGCGHRLEILQRLGATGADLECPSCRSVGLERQLSTFAASTGEAGRSAEPCGAPACGRLTGFG